MHRRPACQVRVGAAGWSRGASEFMTLRVHVFVHRVLGECWSGGNASPSNPFSPPPPPPFPPPLSDALTRSARPYGRSRAALRRRHRCRNGGGAAISGPQNGQSTPRAIPHPPPPPPPSSSLACAGYHGQLCTYTPEAKAACIPIQYRPKGPIVALGPRRIALVASRRKDAAAAADAVVVLDVVNRLELHREERPDGVVALLPAFGGLLVVRASGSWSLSRPASLASMLPVRRTPSVTGAVLHPPPPPPPPSPHLVSCDDRDSYRADSACYRYSYRDGYRADSAWLSRCALEQVSCKRAHEAAADASCGRVRSSAPVGPGGLKFLAQCRSTCPDSDIPRE